MAAKGKSPTKKTTKSQGPKKITATTKKKNGVDENGRSDQRVPVQLLVDYQCGGNYLFDFCRDLGAGGVFIETTSPLPQGSSVDLTFTLPDSKETLETKGRVIWVQAEVPEKNLTPGMGVQFEAFDKSQRQALEKFIARYHGQDAFRSAADGKRSAM